MKGNSDTVIVELFFHTRASNLFQSNFEEESSFIFHQINFYYQKPIPFCLDYEGLHS